MLKQIGNSDEFILEKDNHNYEALFIKCLYLTQQNSRLHYFIKDLEMQLCSLRSINQQLVSKCPNTAQLILQQLRKQNANLEKSLFHLTKINQQLSSDVLMKSQLIVQNENQFRELVISYQSKIFQLRTNLQAKQAFMTSVQLKNAEKGDLFNLPTRAHIMYFNQLSQLRGLVERYRAQITSLHLLVTSKSQQIVEINQKLQKYQNLLKKGQSWGAYTYFKDRYFAQTQKTKQRSTLKIKLEQQLTRYDTKYKNLSFISIKESNSSSIYQAMKLIITQMYSQSQNTQSQIKNLKKIIANKDKSLHEIQLAYGQLQKQMHQQRVEVEFYRHNFKQLVKVTTQKKIKYYDQYYEEILPIVKKDFNNRRQMIAYWKQQQKTSSIFHGSEAKQRRMLSKFIQKVSLKSKKRSLSCISRHNIFEQGARKVCNNLKLQSSITSFINQTHNVTSVTGYTNEQKGDNLKEIEEKQNILFGEISVIEKPAKPLEKFNKKDRRYLVLDQKL